MPRFVVAVLLLMIFAIPVAAPAGDEVDYSAPYLVVEDGELVTKYPAREHDGGDTAAGTEVDVESDITPSNTSSNRLQLVGALAIVTVLAFLLWVRSRE